MMRLVVSLCVLSLAQVAFADPLSDQLAALVKKSPARVGVYVEALERQQTSGVDATRPFPLASTFKLPLAVVVLDDVAHGKLPALDGTVRVLPADLIKGHSPLCAKYPRGGDVPLREVLSLLLEESDNSAADALFRLCGGGKRITERLRALGLDGISIDRNEHQLGRVITGEGATARKQAEAFLKDGRDHASPAAMAAIETKLWRNELALPAALAGFLRDELGRCNTGPQRLRAGLPPGTALAHRTGTCPGPTEETAACVNDIGIVTLPSGQHVAIAVMSETTDAPAGSVEAIIAAVAKTVWAHYAR